MNKIENAINYLQGRNKFLESENDLYSNHCIAMNNIAIQALEEKLEIDSLIQEYDTDCTAKDIVESFIKYVKEEDNELAGFRVLTNADKENYEAWKLENQAHEHRHYGKWIPDGYEYNHCSECGYEHDSQEYVTPYCPNCGAKMEES